MKKIAVILAALMLLSCIPLFATAGPLPNYQVYPNDPVQMPKSTPTIDGKVEWDEGWSSPAKLDFDTAGFFWRFQPMSMNADLYFAYSDDGLYFAADVTEFSFVTAKNEANEPNNYIGNDFVISDGDGTIVEGVDDDSSSGTDRPEGTFNYGYNGDIISLNLDPSRICQDKKLIYCPWYNIGVFAVEGEEDAYEARVYRSKGNYGDITDRVETAVTVKEHREYAAFDIDGDPIEDSFGETAYNNGAVIEMFLPWEILIEDIDEITYGTGSVTKEELAEHGAEISAAVQYMDRFYDREADAIDNWGRWITVCYINDNGVLGAGSSGNHCDVNGLTLINGDEFEIKNPFEDVPSNKWYAKGVLFCNHLGYMSGTGEGIFDPNAPVTRAMFVQILAKIADFDLSLYTKDNNGLPFTDTKASWYSRALKWAYFNGFTSGLTDTTFGPDAKVSREQLATFLYNYAKKNGIDVSEIADISEYPDADQVAKYAKNAVAWAVANGLISGVKVGEVNYLQPKGDATRGQIALIVRNFMENASGEYKPISSYKLSP